jgi:hypothetical protein
VTTKKKQHEKIADHDAWLESLKGVELCKVIRPVNDETAWNLLCNAFEGGAINYWARVDNSPSSPFFPAGEEKPYTYLQDVPFVGGVLTIEQDEDGYTPCPFKLTRERMAVAFQLMAEKYPHHWKDVVKDNADATTGDVFVQLAVLGDIVYG